MRRLPLFRVYRYPHRVEHNLNSASVDWCIDRVWLGPVGCCTPYRVASSSVAGLSVGWCPPIRSRVACVERYFGQWEMLAVSLWAVALFRGTDSVIPGFYRHALLDFACKTSEAVTKGVTDEEGASRGGQRCLLHARFLCFHLFVLAQFF